MFKKWKRTKTSDFWSHFYPLNTNLYPVHATFAEATNTFFHMKSIKGKEAEDLLP